jgi:hypothetical protein
MHLTAREESLIRALRALPPGEADKVLVWVRGMADLSTGRPVDWSDHWTAKDCAEASAAALRRFEEQERRDH